ncbi:hypothetical protein HMPREF3265_07730 [Staphylococcus sp. HMSC62B09]|uniref:hypothetical protein n=1 Tax=Staphylococcus TaxID=1279 RepID=UPI0008A37CF3|nr:MULTISPECIES: hypothetical protein [Staphylococcus]OFV30557.1 hypothetical protein HMPREF3134_02325 [Staphylococcus sp. HMSC14D10]OHS39457.1 hypothetical protein HMPREF3265_07730 [Staphylococcus sp. HMSC62B09]
MQTIKHDGSILHIYFENPINKIEKLYIKNEFNSIDVEDTNEDLHLSLDEVDLKKHIFQEDILIILK